MTGQIVGTCEFCGKPVRDAIGTMWLIQGWDEKRSQGGGNKITNRRELGKVACNRYCVTVDPNQIALWS